MSPQLRSSKPDWTPTIIREGESVPVPHIDKRGRILSRGYDTEGKPIPTCDASGGYLVAMLGMGGLVIRAEATEMFVIPEDAQ